MSLLKILERFSTLEQFFDFLRNCFLFFLFINLSYDWSQIHLSSILSMIITGCGCLFSPLSWLKRVDKRERDPERNWAIEQPFPMVLDQPALAFYWNIKGEVDPQRHIVKPVTPITKALKWVEDGEEEQEEAENWGGVDGESGGGKGPEATIEEVNCVCRWLRGSG